MVVVVLPGRRDRPGIAEGVEDQHDQALVTESTVEALGVAVLPRAAWILAPGARMRGAGHVSRSVCQPVEVGQRSALSCVAS